MAISREQKETQVKALSEKLKNANMTVLVAYKGMSVKQAQQLRKLIKGQGGSFHIVKNAMFKLALADSFEGTKLDLEGPVAVAFGNDDPVMPAKAVMDFAKENPVLEPIAAINEQGQLFDADDVKKLAALPPRDLLIGQLVGTIAAPLSGLVTVLGGNIRGLVTALDGIAKAKEA